MFPSYMMARRLERRPADYSDSLVARLGPRRAELPPKILSIKEIEEARRAGTKSQVDCADVDPSSGAALPPDWPQDGLYICEEDDRVSQIAKKFVVNADLLVENNRISYPGLNKLCPLRRGTVLKLPPPKTAEEVRLHSSMSKSFLLKNPNQYRSVT